MINYKKIVEEGKQLMAEGSSLDENIARIIKEKCDVYREINEAIDSILALDL